jgi:hypothetical protein
LVTTDKTYNEIWILLLNARLTSSFYRRSTGVAADLYLVEAERGGAAAGLRHTIRCS